MIKSPYAERTRGTSTALATGVRTALTIGAGATVLAPIVALIATRYDKCDFVWLPVENPTAHRKQITFAYLPTGPADAGGADRT